MAAPSGWAGRRVFLTGHTGFKGGWLALWLANLGAEVCGYALDPSTSPSLFESAQVGAGLNDTRGNLLDAASLEHAVQAFQPDVVFHLAAQPLVRASYLDPVGTYETNVIGTARVLDTVRRQRSVRAVLSVTTDKCYENKEWHWGYRETDPMGGYDPYSSSKGCAELVTAAYRQSYFPVGSWKEHGVALASARAGNVIGGGDWSGDRLIPDLVRGFAGGQPVPIRRPAAIRPWQHVLEPLAGYISLAEHLLREDAPRYATAYNFGPSDEDARPVAWIADRIAKTWGDGASWVLDEDPGAHEAGFLKLDSSRARSELGWKPRLHLGEALDWTIEWFRAHAAGANMHKLTLDQIARYSERMNEAP